MSTRSSSTVSGFAGCDEPAGPIDCGNAGTLMRLLCGILAGQTGRFELVGDESLSSRPMERVAEPLRRMGAEILTTDGHAPLVVEGRTAHADRVHASGRVRAGEVGCALRRPVRRRR